MEYLACELGLDGDPERVVKVVREAEDVFDAAALASFEGAYVTDGHPPRLLTAETAAPYVRGHVEHIRRSGRQVIGDLHIFDPALASDIRSGRKRELSCGYDCTWLPLPDGRYRQKNIRGNHVAVVPKGRAGRDVAIQDAAAQAGKGTYMNEFGKAILTALGLAAKDAQPEELDGLVQTAGAALDANPSAQPEPPAGEGPPAGAEPPAADAALERVGLARHAHDRAGIFSRGMAQRLNLARVLLAKPRLLLLDEPGTGLDVASRALLRDIVREARARGTAVVWISHDLDTDGDLADRVLTLRKKTLEERVSSAVSATCTSSATLERNSAPAFAAKEGGSPC